MKTESLSKKQGSLILRVLFIILVIVVLGGGWLVVNRMMSQPEPPPKPMAVRAKIPSPPADPRPKKQMTPEKADQGTSTNLHAGTDTDVSAPADATELDPLEANAKEPMDTSAPKDMAGQAKTSPPMDTDNDSASLSPAEPDAPKPRKAKTQVATQDNPEPAAAAPEQPSPETTASGDVSHDAPPAPSDAVARTGLTIQVASFRTKAYAEEKIAELKQKGHDAFIYEITGKSRRPWYMVRFGHFENRPQADEFLARFNKEENSSAIVVMQE